MNIVYNLYQLSLVTQTANSLNDEHLVKIHNTAHEVGSMINELTAFLACFQKIDNYYRDFPGHPNELDLVHQLLPSLDDCIHDPSRIEQAVDRYKQIESLHKVYGGEAPVLNSIYEQAQVRRRFIVSELCNRLEHLKDPSHDEIKLIVDLLSRCCQFSDRELRLKYLQARDNWFNSACEKQESTFDNVVAVHCDGLPMIYEEYKSLFGPDAGFKMKDLTSISSADLDKEDGSIINSWLLLKASIFVSSLEVYLNDIAESDVKTPTMIGDTMRRCFELTEKLSLIGFDFGTQLRPLFSKAIIEQFRSSLDKATLKFEHSFTSTISTSVGSLLLPVDDEILRISNMGPGQQLPKSIEHYPVFRIYFLHLIDSLRWLQTARDLISPVGMCLETFAALNASLMRIMKALAVVMNTDDNSNNIHLTKIAISLVTEVFPFLSNYCDRIFPEKMILSAVGFTRSEFKNISMKEPERLKNFSLDTRRIIDPLKNIMPTLLQTI